MLRLKNKQIPITEWTMRDIMTKNNIHAKIVHKKKYRDKKQMECKYKNLISRNWTTDEPGKKLFTDVTYFKTPSGFIYISSLIDTFDWKIIGYAISLRNDISLVKSMLRTVKKNIDGAIIHSDHGYQYSSHWYIEWCKKHNVKISMSRKGNSLDNYPIEHHWSFLKGECLERIPFKKRKMKLINATVKKYYNWFNVQRINHQILK
jgi:transposase InsO family protein